MNSLDPWRAIVTDAYGDIILPRAHYGHPFYREIPSWIHYGGGNDTTRQLFDGVFIGADPVVSGFFDSVKNAVLKYTGTSATNQFIKDKGLGPYVKLAATAVATAYGGPAAGAAAGALSGPVMSLGVKDKQKAAAAKRQIQQVSTAVQQRSPELAPAVDVAQEAINQTATTYHVAQITNDAKAGNPEAQRALDNLKQAAARGDVQAQQALQLASAIDREQGRAEASGTVSGWVDIIGANMTNIIGAELTALSVPGYALPGYGYPSYGYGFGYAPFRPYGGVFFGAEAPPSGAVVAPPAAPPVVVPVAPGVSVATADAGRTGLLAEIAPVMAPGTGEIGVKKKLDAQQVLHVEICVDGKCYKTSMDLAPAIELVMKNLSQWHDAAHAPPPQPTTVVQAVEKAIGAATDSMVGVMVGHHVAVMTSGWLSDIGGAIGGTLRKLQPIISTVATGVATAYGGPVAGAAAAKLAPMITNLQANALDPKGSPAKKAAAAAALQRVNAVAATDPTAAKALAAANQAVKNTTVAYYVKDTAQQAAAGNTTAQTDISNLVQAAEAGDPAAKSTFEVLAQTFAQEMMKSEAGAKLWEQVTGRGPGTVSPTTAAGWYDIIGAVADAPMTSSPPPVPPPLRSCPVPSSQELIQVAIRDVRAEEANPHPYRRNWTAYVWTLGPHGLTHANQFLNYQKALEWVRAVTSETDTDIAIAIFDKLSPHWPNPVNWTKTTRSTYQPMTQEFGPCPSVQPDGSYGFGATEPTVSGDWYDIAVGQWYDIIGAALDDFREKARAHAVTKPGSAAGVLITTEGQLHGRGFRNLDDAIDWLQHITRNRGAFSYAAAYEKDADGAAYIQAEELGGTSQPAPIRTPIPREAPATVG